MPPPFHPGDHVVDFLDDALHGLLSPIVQRTWNQLSVDGALAATAGDAIAGLEVDDLRRDRDDAAGTGDLRAHADQAIGEVDDLGVEALDRDDAVVADAVERGADVGTAAAPLDASAAGSPNVVKVVLGEDSRALYFSRSVVPYARDAAVPVRYWQHLGVYAFRPEALARWLALEPTEPELAEKLAEK